ncbi:glycosyltransferase family 2 protein [Psychromarinibacter halotolerans]|uniref:Glycosyltransferase family 2 protein n=1 Tax=Psychromarinibacter halotolerans TaxID=1775175 RepID=A0ABV7GWD6_9RHOB|nr:glycosyltransferase family A protein [Psychromarinibacter halotolerans]MDF0596583.1 glycosyltransferase family A protein [Psychromarinibacter halotolerans]
MSEPVTETVPAALRLSIIIPVYNRASTIDAALSSLCAGGRSDVEVIVVDDGSSDSSVQAVKAAIAAYGMSANTTLLQQDNAGPGAARNRGAKAARGRYLAFFDSDDRWFPWTLDTCLQVIADNPAASLFYLQSVDFTRDAGPKTPERTEVETQSFPRFLDAIEAVWQITYASCNVIIRRDVFDKHRGFTHEVRCAEDTDLFLRADPDGACVLITSPVMLGREVGAPGSLTGNVACVVGGLDHIVAKERAGLYPGGAGSDGKRQLLLAGATISTVRLCFATGYPGTAYMRLIRNAGILIRADRWRVGLRLLLTPILSIIRPKHYRFRLRQN